MRRVLPPVLIAVGTLLAFVAIFSVWISRQALETDQWTATSSRLLERPAVQTALAAYLVDQLYANVDVSAQLKAALPPRAQALAAPAAGALRSAATTVTEKALQNPRVQDAWKAANRNAHVLLLRVINGGGRFSSTTNGVVTLDLKAVLAQMAQRIGVGGKAVGLLPASAARITVLRSRQLDAVQKIAKALKPLAAVLVLVALACYAAAIGLATAARRRMVRAAGIGLIFAGVAALVARRLAGQDVVDSLSSTAATRPAVEDVWQVGTSLLVDVAAATILYGVVAVAGAWLAGPSRPATAIRRMLSPYLRNAKTTYAAVAALVLLLLWWAPTEGLRRVLPAIVLIALIVAGVEALRRQAGREFPPGEDPSVSPASEAALKAGAIITRVRHGRDGGGAEASNGEEPVDQLERLTALHTGGSLTDDEFATAKQRLLTGA